MQGSLKVLLRISTSFTAPDSYQPFASPGISIAEPLLSNILFSIITLPGVDIRMPLARLLPKKLFLIITSGVHDRFSRASPTSSDTGIGSENVNSKISGETTLKTLTVPIPKVFIASFSIKPILSPLRAQVNPILWLCMNLQTSVWSSFFSMIRTLVPWTFTGSSIRARKRQLSIVISPLQFE